MRAFALLLLSLAASTAWPATAQELPGRVGRLAWMDGSVAVYQDPARGWDGAYLNTPITSENSVWTDPGARAVVQVGPMALRLDGASQLDISRIDDHAVEATLERGMIAISVRHFLRGDRVRMSTPQASFLIQSEGRYRLEADPDRGESRLTVFSGIARMQTADGTVRVPAGRSVVVWGEDVPQFAFQDAFTLAFDRWSMARDEEWVEREAPRFVSVEMTGYEDLDAYGEWSNDPAYGVVWFPSQVSEDWAPYRYGRWRYVAPWGWTWVDDAPWGYAPFHYGRWVHLEDRWAWCPGRRVEHPVWAPAMVAFVGGTSWSASVSSGGPVVGWYPLAPSEPYRPWYRASPAYVNQINVTVVNVPARVREQHVEWNRERAITVVRRDVLLEQKPVHQAIVAVPAAVARSAPVASAASAVLPSPAEVHRVEQARRDQAPARGPAAAAAPSAPGAHAPTATAPRAPSGAASAASGGAARPRFAKPSAAPAPAPRGATPPPSNAPLARAPAAPSGIRGAAPASPPTERAPVGTGPAARATPSHAQPARPAVPAAPATPAQREAHPAAPAERAAMPAAANGRGPQEQPRANEQQQRNREAEQAQQRAQQEQQRAREAQQAQQAQQRAQQEQQRAREAQQAQQRAQQEQQRAHEAQQAQQAQQRAQQEQQRAREAQQAQQAQQRAQQEQQRAREAQQAQQRAQQEQQRAREAQQRAQQEQQRAREAQQAQQRAQQEQQRAREAQQAQQRAQQAKPQPAEHGRGGEKAPEAKDEKNPPGQ